MKIFAYTRVSGRGQLDGDGPERQNDAIKKFCAAHKLECVCTFFEPAVSGTVEAMERPKFSAMLADITEQGMDIGAIVVERVDRLARDLIVSELLLRECAKIGVKVYAADRGELVDLASTESDPTQVLIRQVLGALAQWQKTELVNKLRVARNRIKATGRRCEGNIPYGSGRNEREVLNCIWGMIEDGKSLDQMTHELNAMNLKTRKGTDWARGSLSRLRKKYRAQKQKANQ